MDRCVSSALAILAMAGVASAVTVTCPAPPNGGVPADIMGLSISCGGLSFSNFNVIPATGFSEDLTPTVSLVSVDLSRGSVNLVFNPNLSAPTGAQDIHFYYQVAGPVNGAGLAVGGVNATIIERVCSTPIPNSGPAANTCSDGSTPVANFVGYSMPPGPNAVKQAISGGGTSFWVYKDVGVGANQLTHGGGGLTSFTQSWENGGGHIPEPASMLLIGSGIIALGMLRRRLRKR
jgi:hypothetical protein